MRSDSLHEFLERRPSFFIRFGATTVLITFLIFVLLSSYVKYPSVLNARAVIMAVNAPAEIRSRADAELVRLFNKEGDDVAQGQIIGIMESGTDYSQATSTAATLEKMKKATEDSSFSQIDNLELTSFQGLGDLQPFIEDFIKNFVIFRKCINNGLYWEKRAVLYKDLEHLKRMNAVLDSESTLDIQDLSLSKEDFDANQKLRNEGVISVAEFRAEKSKYLKKQEVLPGIQTQILVNQTDQDQKLKEIAELNNQIKYQRVLFEQSINTLSEQIANWRLKYLLIAPASGKVVFSSFVREKQILHIGDNICYIQPDNISYYAEVDIPQNNMGRLRDGQPVYLTLDSYPSGEFGRLEGKLGFIAKITGTGGFRATVPLKGPLETNYHKLIDFKGGLTASAEIVITDASLMSRILYNLREAIKSK
jgi:multidrug resistance efflux pump